jgi:hypothetical protein
MWGRLVPLVEGYRTVEMTAEQPQYTIGRGKENDVQVANAHVSTAHCKVFRGDDAGTGGVPTAFIMDTRCGGVACCSSPMCRDAVGCGLSVPESRSVVAVLLGADHVVVAAAAAGLAAPTAPL